MRWIRTARRLRLCARQCDARGYLPRYRALHVYPRQWARPAGEETEDLFTGIEPGERKNNP
jgi:hypothetical protein